ncbi:MAG: hypothetical protein PWQ82_1293 [Thermosediminibacterales bacterium]|nr:hypothetical protein [Thermosediminibacterales bacterium]MDK2836513.1 hypothetical protein [Thermosediminibacterales bacterium]
MAKISILTTNHYSPEGNRIIYGGAERYGVEFTKMLVEMGFDVEWWQIGTGWESEIIPGVKLRTIPESEAPLKTLPRLNQAFYEKTVDADLAVYFVTFLAYPQVKEKSISISHGIFWDYPGFDTDLQTDTERREWLRRLYIALNGPQKVVSVDTATIQWAVSTWPGLFNKFEYIPNFVDTEKFKPGDKVLGNNKVRVAFPRRMTSVRGINEAAYAAEVLTKKYKNVEFHFIGRAHSDELEKQLTQWANRSQNIYYYWKSPEDMPRVLVNMDIVLIPSKSTEGTALSCLEAMAVGLPIIAGYVGGLSDLIINGYNGLLIKPTPKNLVNAIDYLLKNPDLRQKIGRNARETALAFDITIWKKRWAEVISEVLGK